MGAREALVDTARTDIRTVERSRFRGQWLQVRCLQTWEPSSPQGTQNDVRSTRRRTQNVTILINVLSPHDLRSNTIVRLEPALSPHTLNDLP